MTRYKAVIVGSGPAGQSCAVRLAQLGAKVAVVERDYVGGICTNWGCTPSKAMIESAKIARAVEESGQYGIDVPGFSVDFTKVAARRNQVVESSRQRIVDLLRHHGVDIHQGEAECMEPGRVRIRRGKLHLDGYDMRYTGQEEDIEGEHIVLATGSYPLIPPFADHNDPSIVSSNRLISIETLPESLTIVGGGVIGLEFATIFSGLGSRVTIVELLDRVLATLDPEVSEEITRHLAAQGTRILTSHKVVSIENGVLKAEDQRTGQKVELASEAFLIAVGRQAVINEEMFNRVGIAYTRQGITVNQYLQTNVPGIWAVGDATGKSILAHVGMQQGIVCAENVMAGSSASLRAMDYSVIPAVVYSIPEVVAVGNVPQDMDGVSVFKVPFSINMRARIEGYDEGFVKIWVRDGRVVAAQAVGHNVSEVIQGLADMIALRTQLEDVAHIIHAHPSYSEITRSILEYALDRAVDFYL
jgi:dihydrolipoamide dehydrogenase